MTTIDIPLTPLVNLRDLGGTEIDGQPVRPGFALRSDDVATIDPASAEDLIEAGLAAIIDLRSNRELKITGRGVFAETSVAYHHIPFLSATKGGLTADAMHPVLIGHMYVGLIEDAAPAVVAALEVLASAEGAVVFHCAAGKDRTGVLAASLLLALGATQETVVADYAKTEPNIDAIHIRTAPIVGPLLEAFGITVDALARQAAAEEGNFSAQAMVLALDTLTERHGDPIAPLRAAGLDAALINRLRERAGLV